MHQLMVVGKDVRSTPMHWAYQGKQLDCIVRHLSWRPPWVREPNSGDAGDDVFARLGSMETIDGQRLPGCCVDDTVGLGRTAYSWFILNCAYNSLYDIQRLNTSAAMNQASVAIGDGDIHKQTRWDFTRDSPDIACFNLVLRTELTMKMVMPEVVPHDDDAPFMSMIRFESGVGGNHHGHGFTVGKGNPRLIRVDDADDEEFGDHVDSEGDRSGAEDLSKGEDADVEDDGAGDVEDESGSDISDGQPVAEVCSVSGISFVTARCAPEQSAAPLAGQKRRILARRRTPQLVSEPVRTLPESRLDPEQRGQNKAQLEREFWDCYGRSVSEWNPTFTPDGQ